jgi:hypothetical protein
VTEQDLAWIDGAPVVASHRYGLQAPAHVVFDRLSDVGGWAEWCGGISTIRVNGAPSGIGTMRTVWTGPVRFEERFVEWEPGHRLTFAIVGSNVPGLRSMVEDWAVAPDPSDPERSVLTIRIGVAPTGVPRPLHRALRAALTRATRGTRGIVRVFS